MVVIVAFSGRLGRLVEQYYWRFKFEGTAITGLEARKGASKGGKAKSQSAKVKQSAWQALALEIWARLPGRSKVGVAAIIKNKLNLTQSARHIARYLKRP
jgi:hypothetical protein